MAWWKITLLTTAETHWQLPFKLINKLSRTKSSLTKCIPLFLDTNTIRNGEENTFLKKRYVLFSKNCARFYGKCHTIRKVSDKLWFCPIFVMWYFNASLFISAQLTPPQSSRFLLTARCQLIVQITFWINGLIYSGGNDREKVAMLGLLRTENPHLCPFWVEPSLLRLH